MDAVHPLRKYRHAKSPKLSQDELAASLGVTKATISRWESGERFPERDLWPRIREVTGLGVDELSEAAPAKDAAE